MNINSYLEKLNRLENKNIKIILASFILVIFSNLWGHFLPPYALPITPILVNGLALLILFLCDLNIYYKSIIVSFIFLFNDILVRLHSGGDNDAQGNAIILLVSYITLSILPGTVLFYGFKNRRIFKAMLSIILPSFIIFFYFLHFSSFGMSTTNSIGKTVNESKKGGYFINEFNLKDKILITKVDTFILKNGWIEKRIKVQDYGFIKKHSKTNYNFITINIGGNFENGYTENLYVKLNHKKYNAYYKAHARTIRRIENKFDTISISFLDRTQNDLEIARIKIPNSISDSIVSVKFIK